MALRSRTLSRRTVLTGLAGFSMALWLHGCTQNEEGDSTTSIKVGTNTGNVPWQFRNEAGELVGFEIDLLQEIGTRLGRSVEFQDIPFTGLFPAVLSTRIDAAIASITITEERLETLDFAQPYYDSDQSLTVQANSDISKLEDLKDKTIAVDSNSTGDTWAQANQATYGYADILRYEGLEPAMMDLAAGKYDAYISDIPSTQFYVKDHPDLAVIQRIPTGEQYSVMFAKGNLLRDEVNEVISTLKQDGTLAQIHKKWFGSDPEAGTSTVEVLPTP